MDNNNDQRPKGQGSMVDEYRAGISVLLVFAAIMWANNPNADNFSKVAGVVLLMFFVYALFPKFWLANAFNWLVSAFKWLGDAINWLKRKIQK